MEAATPRNLAVVRHPESPADEVTLDRLAGDWWIHQLRRGHRYASDDVLTAWFAAESCPQATTVLDLGAGIGAVGLLVLLRLGASARLSAVEVQPVSVGLLHHTLIQNALSPRVDVHLGDLRDPTILPRAARFDLVTANPPYLPPASASRSPHPQRASARLELHGDVFDYCRAATRWLAPTGLFCFCHRAGDLRPERAMTEAGLELVARRDVVFREGSAPALALFACDHATRRAGASLSPLVLRDRHGRFTEDYRAVRRAMWIEA